MAGFRYLPSQLSKFSNKALKKMKSKYYSVNWTTEQNYVYIVLQQAQMFNFAYLETLTVLVVRSIQVKTVNIQKMQIGIEII